MQIVQRGISKNYWNTRTKNTNNNMDLIKSNFADQAHQSCFAITRVTNQLTSTNTANMIFLNQFNYLAKYYELFELDLSQNLTLIRKKYISDKLING